MLHSPRTGNLFMESCRCGYVVTMASKLANFQYVMGIDWQLVRQLVLVLNLCVSFLIIEHILKSVTVCWSSSC